MERSLGSLEKAHQGEDEEHDKANLGDQGGGAGEGAETKEGCDQRDNQKDNSVVEHGIGCLELDCQELGGDKMLKWCCAKHFGCGWIGGCTKNVCAVAFADRGRGRMYGFFTLKFFGRSLARPKPHGSIFVAAILKAATAGEPID